MSFPPPTANQAKVLWISLTALSIGVIIALLAGFVWGAGWVLGQLSSILLPLAVAGIAAYILDPVVDHLEKRRIPRHWGISLVFLLALVVLVLLLATVVPRLIEEVRDLAHQTPDFAKDVKEKVSHLLATPKAEKWTKKAREVWDGEMGQKVTSWVAERLPLVYNFFFAQLTRVGSWFGLLAGFALVPVYVFYFLLEKRGIADNWESYLPVKESKMKGELAFVIRSINEYLILFFRGQVLVAVCDGLLLMAGFFAIGLNYALLLGLFAGVLSIVPFLGVVVSIVPALILAAVQFGDWLHPLLVLGLFALVQFLEGFVISPKIMGDRVGLHPLTIMIAVMVGTTLMGGIIGGILAIPLTAALRVLMFRYIWKSPTVRKR